MSFLSNFAALNGRIARARFWLGAVSLVVVSWIVYAVLSNLGLGVAHVVAGRVVLDNGQVATRFVQTSYSLSPLGWLVFNLVFAYPWIALGLKRRHDCDSPGIDLLAFYGLTVLFAGLPLIGYNPHSGLGIFMGTLMFLYGLYMLITLGFLAGTRGPNRFGADPLQRLQVE